MNFFEFLVDMFFGHRKQTRTKPASLQSQSFNQPKNLFTMTTKTQLTDIIVNKTGMRRKDVAKCLNAMIESISEELIKGEKVQILGFGTFSVVEKPERKGRNPRTGEEITIPQHSVVRFKGSKNFGIFD